MEGYNSDFKRLSTQAPNTEMGYFLTILILLIMRLIWLVWLNYHFHVLILL